VMSQGSYSIFFTRPVTVTLLALTALSILFPLIRNHFSAAKIKERD